MQADELFDWKDGKVELKVARPPTRHRLEFYENTNPKHPVTRYGLVLDINRSTERYNLNFETITPEELLEIAQGRTTSDHTSHCIMALLARFVRDDILSHPFAFITSSKRNTKAGTGQHDLRYGRGAYCHEVGAILLVDPHRAPVVHLFLNGEEFVFSSDEWEAVCHSSHPAKKWQARF